LPLYERDPLLGRLRTNERPGGEKTQHSFFTFTPHRSESSKQATLYDASRSRYLVSSFCSQPSAHLNLITVRSWVRKPTVAINLSRFGKLGRRVLLFIDLRTPQSRRYSPRLSPSRLAMY